MGGGHGAGHLARLLRARFTPTIPEIHWLTVLSPQAPSATPVADRVISLHESVLISRDSGGGSQW